MSYKQHLFFQSELDILSRCKPVTFQGTVLLSPPCNILHPWPEMCNCCSANFINRCPFFSSSPFLSFAYTFFSYF